MLWIVFTILAVILWSIGNILDKYVLDKWVKEPFLPVSVLVSLGLISSIIILITLGYGSLSTLNILLVILSGGFYIVEMYYYFKAARIEEISRIVPLFYLSNFLIAIFAAIFLGEILSITSYTGIVILVIGAVLISVKKLEKPQLDKSSVYMVLSATFMAANMLITKFVLNYTDFWTVFAWSRIGTFIFFVPIAYFNRKRLIQAIKKTKNVAYGLVSINEVINLSGLIFITIASSIGLVTVVTGLSTIQPLFVSIFAIILSIFFPKIIKEEINRNIIVQKLIAIILIIVGSVLLI
jgi:transporter family protein